MRLMLNKAIKGYVRDPQTKDVVAINDYANKGDIVKVIFYNTKNNSRYFTCVDDSDENKKEFIVFPSQIGAVIEEVEESQDFEEEDFEDYDF